VIHRLHAALPKALSYRTAGLLSAVVLNDIRMRIDSQRAVSEGAAEFLCEAATPNCTAAHASMTGKAMNTTYNRLVGAGVAGLDLSGIDRLFGFVPGGELAMAIALSNHVPQKTKAALELAALAARATFISESEELDISTVASSSLLTGMAVAGNGDEDNDYDALVRNLVRAIARSRHLVVKAVAADGAVHDWGEFANKAIDMISGRGYLAFTSADNRDLTGVIFEFGRQQSARELPTSPAPFSPYT